MARVLLAGLGGMLFKDNSTLVLSHYLCCFEVTRGNILILKIKVLVVKLINKVVYCGKMYIFFIFLNQI
jgi:hypothetical protein